MENIYFLSILFFLIAIFYSSVGFGGGSSYLAILILAGLDIYLVRSTALMCNIIVVSGGTFIFYVNGYLNLRKNLPLVAMSVPFAFLGGYLPLEVSTIFIILGFTLLVAAVLMWVKPHTKDSVHTTKGSTLQATGIGAGIGDHEVHIVVLEILQAVRQVIGPQPRDDRPEGVLESL